MSSATNITCTLGRLRKLSAAADCRSVESERKGRSAALNDQDSNSQKTVSFVNEDSFPCDSHTDGNEELDFSISHSNTNVTGCEEHKQENSTQEMQIDSTLNRRMAKEIDSMMAKVDRINRDLRLDSNYASGTST